MKRILIVFLVLIGVVACGDENDGENENQKTIFVYMPWSSDLTDYFYNNIADLESAIARKGLDNERIVVFFSTSANKASMYEITLEEGVCRHTTLKEYDNPAFTTENGLTSILSDMISFAPAKTYSMIIGCHGMGWLPVGAETAMSIPLGKMHWECEGVPLTRYFGGTTPAYQAEISTLAQAIENNGIAMTYILFDDCYMASVEVAYQLRDATHFLIGSTSEMMAYGMPYDVIGEYLLGVPDYKAICDGFHSFYSAYDVMPCGTLSVVNCDELESLAAIMKEINDGYYFDVSYADYLQCLDGYSPSIFYDLGDYVDHLCADETLLNRFRLQLSHVVPYSVHTEYFYSMNRGQVLIEKFSGITISDPSANELASGKTLTDWYVATH